MNIKLVVFQWVDPSATRVAVVARGITITMGKQRNLFWMQLSRQKFGWIKKDPNAALDNDFDPAVEGLSEPGFISPYFTMAGQGKSPRGTTLSPVRRSSLRQWGCPVTRNLRRRNLLRGCPSRPPGEA